jgi:hypothetical protein
MTDLPFGPDVTFYHVGRRPAGAFCSLRKGSATAGPEKESIGVPSLRPGRKCSSRSRSHILVEASAEGGDFLRLLCPEAQLSFELHVLLGVSHRLGSNAALCFEGSAGRFHFATEDKLLEWWTHEVSMLLFQWRIQCICKLRAIDSLLNQGRD